MWTQTISSMLRHLIAFVQVVPLCLSRRPCKALFVTSLPYSLFGVSFWRQFAGNGTLAFFAFLDQCAYMVSVTLVKGLISRLQGMAVIERLVVLKDWKPSNLCMYYSLSGCHCHVPNWASNSKEASSHRIRQDIWFWLQSFDAIDELPAGFYFVPMTEISWVVIYRKLIFHMTGEAWRCSICPIIHRDGSRLKSFNSCHWGWACLQLAGYSG